VQYQRMDLKAAELSGDPFFGLKGAEYFRPAHLGALGFAWLASSSLRTAFQRLSRYARMINDKLTITLEEDEQLFYVSIDAQLPFNPALVRFKQSEPADPGYFYELFRCPIEFNSEHTTLVINLDAMDKRLTGSNDELAKLNEHIVVKYLAHLDKGDIVNRTRAAIIDGLGSGLVTETSIAESLHMTPRNLHRKLQKEDTSFKTLMTEIRQDLAHQYIKDRSKTLTEIAFLLGFSEVSSFSRAYKGWNGQPPSETRQALA